MFKMHGYMEIVEDLGSEFRGFCKDHNLEYRNIDDDGLYRISGNILNLLKLNQYMTKLHKEYLGKLEA
mgnify:CR=1 FL=1